MHTLSPPDSGIRRDAFNLMSALDAYDLASSQLVERWLDMDLYTEFSKQIDAIRDHGVAVPTLTVLSLELVIAHSELVSTLWQNASVGVPAPKLYEVQARHTAAINMLRAAAAKLLRND
jgi:hypothetical protein